MSRTPGNIVALCYDFDGTLSPGNMQEYGFFSELGREAENFWKDSNELARQHNADPILAYMQLMVEKARIGNIGTTRQAFKDYGKNVKLFKGVSGWFARLGKLGKELDLRIEHYIVSSGLKETIEGTTIAKEFKKIYACSFLYDNNMAAKWPAVAVNYTTKTQFLFRINKGIQDDNDNTTINEHIPAQDRRVPFSRMIYIGDGLTDIPSMKLVKDRGGHSVAVYDPGSKNKKKESLKLLEDRRVDFVAEADYSRNSALDKIIRAIIHDIASKRTLEKLSTKPPSSRRR